MKNNPRQASRSGEARREAVGHARRVRSATDLTNNPDFDLQYGDEWTGGSPCDYYTLQYRGVKAHLRFDFMWTVKVPVLLIEKMFINQVPEVLAQEIETWLDQHLDPPVTSPVAQLRQSTPDVRNLAARHGINVQLADEMMIERGQ